MLESQNTKTPQRFPERGSHVAVIIAIVAVALYLLSPTVIRHLDPNRYNGGRSKRQNDIIQRNSSSIALILGELRSSMSDLMYIKTERYLDQGIAYYPHLDMKAMASQGKIQTTAETKREAASENASATSGTVQVADIKFLHGEAHHHEPGKAGTAQEVDHDHPKTVIRTAADDFRGFIGYLDRTVKPWRDPRLPHHHTNGTELLPWFRLQTLTDPHNVRSYLIGSWWLKEKGTTQVHEALKFVDEGIQNNPEAFQLYLMRGSIFRKLGKEAQAQPNFERSADLSLLIRPPLGDHNPKAEELGWDRYKEQDARTAARMAVLIAKDLGHRAKALKLCRKYAAQFANDGVLQRQIRILTGLEPDPALKKGKERNHQG